MDQEWDESVSKLEFAKRRNAIKLQEEQERLARKEKRDKQREASKRVCFVRGCDQIGWVCFSLFTLFFLAMFPFFLIRLKSGQSTLILPRIFLKMDHLLK